MCTEEVVLVDLFDPGYLLYNNNYTEPIEHVLDISKKYYSRNLPFTYIMCFCDSSCSPEAQELFHGASIQYLEGLRNGSKIVSDSSMAAILYSIKQDIDALNLSKILVIMPKNRRAQMDIFVDYLFTDLYKFTFQPFEIQAEKDSLNCTSGKKHVGDDISHGNLRDITVRSIRTHLETLPALKGNIVILKSYLIPETNFLHGFTTRTGGISYVPTLSSLNLFSSSKRRDPREVVAENFRRLGKAAGFDPKTYVSVKVDHASDVWIMGKSEPDSYDGIVTNQKGVTIAAPGADCIPMLFCDPVRKACGAAHSEFFWNVGAFCHRTFRMIRFRTGARMSLSAPPATQTSFSLMCGMASISGHRLDSYQLENNCTSAARPHKAITGDNEEVESFAPDILLLVAARKTNK
ncbi:laccase domain-containing protein 1 isoform X2 [Xenopus tropicalis]|uniref:Laccase domain-containing protein 1 isoform X2 n=1 Tax=Xenopus tropicalis TaxID=8364 RepID=A0A8J1J8J4_XENTR|nr:laccase domain-containing protein 1 isoform X2 [Xenopus tropicalis]